jgi:hypothetical protein
LSLILYSALPHQSFEVLGRTITALGGALAMYIGKLIYDRADRANERADAYHQEQLELRQLRYLFDLAESVPDSDVRSRLHQDCLLAALEGWFASKAGIVSGAKPDERSTTPSDSLNTP